MTLTVTAAATAPTITQQPTNVLSTAGQTATFSVIATGTAPLAYQWFMNGTAAGTNSSTFSISQTTTGQSGAQVYVKISNSAGSATSNTVTLTVNQAAQTAPTITMQPANSDGHGGAIGHIYGDCDRHGAADLSMVHEWQPSAGTNSSTFYTILQTTTGQTGAQIYVNVTNTANTATSQTVTLAVNAVQASTVNV